MLQEREAEKGETSQVSQYAYYRENKESTQKQKISKRMENKSKLKKIAEKNYR